MAACGSFSGTDSAPTAAGDGGAIEAGPSDAAAPSDDAGTGDAQALADSGTSAFTDDGGVPIDCGTIVNAVFCNDFDEHQMEAAYTSNNSSLEAGVSSAHYVSASGALVVTGTGYVIFSSTFTLSSWTLSFDVHLDPSATTAEEFANITKSGQLTFSWSKDTITVSGATFAAGPGWHHVTVKQAPAAQSATVSVDGIGKPVPFGQTASTLALKLGNLTGTGPIWFDDVLATTP